jgi:glycine/D-amino acid oxidase-like deaminating enzyme
VVVIGGGIIGASTALFLRRKGLSVVLCEKGRIGGEQSSRNWGWCRAMGRDVREIPLIQESLRLWRRWMRWSGAMSDSAPAGYFISAKPKRRCGNTSRSPSCGEAPDRLSPSLRG